MSDRTWTCPRCERTFPAGRAVRMLNVDPDHKMVCLGCARKIMGAQYAGLKAGDLEEESR